MNRSIPLAATLVGIAALGMIVYRAASGAWTMVGVVLTGVVGALLVLVAWWWWDARAFSRTIARLTGTGEFTVVVGGYLVEAGFRNTGGRTPRRSEVVLTASEGGLMLFDPTDRSGRPSLVVGWGHVIDVATGTAEFLNQQREAITISTLEGRLVVVPRTDERAGILSAGSAQTGSLSARIRQTRPGAPLGYPLTSGPAPADPKETT